MSGTVKQKNAKININIDMNKNVDIVITNISELVSKHVIVKLLVDCGAKANISKGNLLKYFPFNFSNARDLSK